jgi:hypothetical protein
MTALVAVLSLLFAQLAVAGYVCPAQSEAAAMVAMTASGQPCDRMDQAQPTLCHQHAVGSAAQSFENVKLPVASLPAIVQVLVVPPVLRSQTAAALPIAAPTPLRPPPDPLFLSTLRLRV